MRWPRLLPFQGVFGYFSNVNHVLEINHLGHWIKILGSVRHPLQLLGGPWILQVLFGRLCITSISHLPISKMKYVWQLTHKEKRPVVLEVPVRVQVAPSFRPLVRTAHHGRGVWQKKPLIPWPESKKRNTTGFHSHLWGHAPSDLKASRKAPPPGG